MLLKLIREPPIALNQRMQRGMPHAGDGDGDGHGMEMGIGSWDGDGELGMEMEVRRMEMGLATNGWIWMIMHDCEFGYG